MNFPGVSWLCPTYGRAPDYLHLLEERVESFVRQDYPGPRELVILNDTPGQQLVCNVPGVRCINVLARFASLGAKFNRLVELAKYDLLMPAEDDDLHLPHAIKRSVEMLGQCDYYKPYQVIFLPSNSPPIFVHNRGVRHHASIFRRSAWEKVSGYPEVSGPQDAIMDARLREQCDVAPEGSDDPALYTYVYRWSVSPCHLSGNEDTERTYRDWGQRPVEPGIFALKSNWRQDYAALCQAHLPLPAPVG